MKNALIALIVIIFTNLVLILNAESINVGLFNEIDIEENIDYLVITCEEYLDSDFQKLIDNKPNSKILTIEEIKENSSFWVNGTFGDGKQITKNHNIFNDTQAKIRNFIKFAYENWNTKYILLGGDSEIIPARFFHLQNVFWFSGVMYSRKTVDIPSDMYYSNLDGTWNDDCDNYFGEIKKYSIRNEDDLDSEIIIGRAPVSSKEDIKIFVEKTLSFQNKEKPNQILLHRTKMNAIDFPKTQIITEKCASHISNDYEVIKLYDVKDKQEYADSFNNKLLTLHIGWGRVESYHIVKKLFNSILFTNEDVSLFNNNFYPIHISIGCQVGRFTNKNEDCLAEKILLCENGGASACIANSHYGYASWYDAHKYSGEFIEQIFYELFEAGTKDLGFSVKNAKEHFVSKAENNIGYRWCIYTITLLGDPQMKI